MPLNPDVVAAFVVGPVCPPADVLDRLSRELADSVLPSTSRRRAFGVCRRQPGISSNVVSLGAWADESGFTDTQLRAALGATRLVTPGNTAGLLFTTRAIQLQAEAGWAEADKQSGRVTFDDDISVEVKPSGIVTRVRGSVDVPFAPDVDFTAKVTDVLSLRTPGSVPPLRARSSTDIDLDGPDVIADALIIGLLSPILGAITFFAAEPAANRFSPGVGGAGAALASQWPDHILTEIRPPLLPGRFNLRWTELTVDERGVRTLGTFAGATRRPRVEIVGPRAVAVREEIGHATKTYSLDTRDLRAPLRIDWSGAASGDDETARVVFHSAGTRSLGVRVDDVDGLTDTASATVRVTIIDAPPGTDPFVAEEKPAA
jgi:hypothetical protein